MLKLKFISAYKKKKKKKKKKNAEVSVWNSINYNTETK